MKKEYLNRVKYLARCNLDVLSLLNDGIRSLTRNEKAAFKLLKNNIEEILIISDGAK